MWVSSVRLSDRNRSGHRRSMSSSRVRTRRTGVSRTASRSNSRRDRWTGWPSDGDFPPLEVDGGHPEGDVRWWFVELFRVDVGRGGRRNEHRDLGRGHPAQDGLHPGDQLAEPERLGDVAGRAEFEPEDHIELGTHGADHDDGDRTDLSHPPAHLGAVHAGQQQVEQDDVGRVIHESTEALDPVGRDVDDESFTAEPRRKRLTIRLLVFHHQHPDAVADRVHTHQNLRHGP